MAIPTFYNGRMTRRGSREREPGSIGERMSSAFRSAPGTTPMPSGGPAALWPDMMPEVQPPPERPSYVPVQQAAPAAAPMEAAPMSAKARAEQEFYSVNGQPLSPAMAMRKRLDLAGQGVSRSDYRARNAEFDALLGRETMADEQARRRQDIMEARAFEIEKAGVAPTIRAESTMAVQGARAELATELQRTKLASNRAALDTKGQQKLDEIKAAWGERTAFTVSDSARRTAQGDANAKRDFLYEVQLATQANDNERAAAMLDGYIDVQKSIAATQMQATPPRSEGANPNAPMENAQATAQGLLNLAQTAPNAEPQTPIDANGNGIDDRSPDEQTYSQMVKITKYADPIKDAAMIKQAKIRMSQIEAQWKPKTKI